MIRFMDEEKQTFRCPTDETRSEIVGCGHVFTADPDDEGLVDCPNCGMWFHPEAEDYVQRSRWIALLSLGQTR
jgi:uncharacterized Zn-finger protein